MSSASTISLSSMQSKPAEEKWLFSEEQLQNTPSRRENVAPAKELNYRQQAANLIQDMGQRLPVNQLTINTAIVYMHRFYMFHSFPAFSRFSIAPTALFLAAKVEEQPRKLEHVIKVCHSCLKPNDEPLDVHSDDYLKQAQQLVEHELIMLQTLGFDISIDHPHTHVVKCTQLVKASKDLSQMAYFMATNSLHLTTFCLKYKPTVVSAMCIHLSCKWSNYEIPLSSEGKAYWTYMDRTITEAMLENIISEFLKILELCPTRLRKLKNYRPSTRDGSGKSTSQSKDHHPNAMSSKVASGSSTSSRSADGRRPLEAPGQIEQKKPSTSLTFAEYKNKREKELKQQQSTGKPFGRPENPKAGQNVLKGNHPNHVPTGQNVTKGNHPNHVPTGQNVTKGIHSGLIPTSLKPSTTSSGASRQGKPGGHPAKHDEKVHLNTDNHKRIDKSGMDSRAIHAAGIPGLQRPKNPSVPSSSHHSNQRDKDHPRLQSKHVMHQDAKPVAKPHDKLLVPRLKEDQAASRNKTSVTQARSIEPEDNILAGMEQKVMEQMNATKVKEVPKLTPAMPSVKTELPNSQISAKEQKPKQSRANLPVQKDVTGKVPVLLELPKTYQGLYEMYKKHPDTLGHQLKLKIQVTGLSEDEKVIWHKLRKSEDRRRKKKHEKQRMSKSHHNVNDGAGPSSGSLTVRIKLPSSARTEALKSGTSSDGSQLLSNSESDTGRTSLPGSAMKAGRKRTHVHDTHVPVVAKHSKKMEGHHRESHDQTKHRHKHSRSGSYHHSKHSSASQIDDTTFRQALSDAVTLVQTGQTVLAGGNDRAVPTVTLKRAETKNGGKEGYVAHSSKHEEIRPTNRSKHLGFDPSAPVSATPPENLFDAETSAQSRTNHISTERGPELSSPEMGEIIDDDEDDDETPHKSDIADHNSNVYRHTSFKPSGSMNDRAKNYNRPDSHKVADKSLPNIMPTNFKRGDQRT